MLLFIPVHGFTLHAFLRLDFPLHFLPSPEGGGLVQARFLNFLPLPQGLLHLPHADQLLQPPSTETVQY